MIIKHGYIVPSFKTHDERLKKLGSNLIKYIDGIKPPDNIFTNPEPKNDFFKHVNTLKNLIQEDPLNALRIQDESAALLHLLKHRPKCYAEDMTSEAYRDIPIANEVARL